MKNVLNAILSFQTSNYYRIMLVILASIGFATMVANAQASNAIAAICNVFTTVQTAIFILGIMLMILGGALYAGSHLMPGSSKGSMQGYGMGMILGGIIGVIIAVLAPYILGVISSNYAITSGCP
jgi:hypothetical protein